MHKQMQDKQKKSSIQKDNTEVKYEKTRAISVI